MPSVVSIFKVTKLRPGHVTMTLAETILSTAAPCNLRWRDVQDRGLERRGIIAGHDIKGARLDHPFHLFVPEAQRLRPQGEGHGLLLARLEADALEALQFLDG